MFTSLFFPPAFNRSARFAQNTRKILTMGDYILLQTKFLIPHPSSTHLSRQSLVSQICHTDVNQRVLLIAPAGYGKTSLLTEVAQQYPHPVVWIHLDEGDNDPATFMSYLLEGLRQRLSHLSITSLRQSEDSITPDRMLIILLNQLLEHTRPPWMLVLDDYDIIRNPVVHQLVTTLLENMPPWMHVVIASRITPALPLARWRARNQVLELRAEQLRFSAEETKQWLNQRSYSLPEKLIKQLVEKTEGWGAGLQLALTLLNESDDKEAVVAQLTGTQPYIFDYLMEEVFGQQPDEIQSFLLRSSIFAELNPETCATVLGMPAAHEILLLLEKSNLFISPLDYQKRWYRYHQLFRDFLFSKFKMLHPDLYTTTHAAAGQYFASRGQSETAIQHFIHAQDERQAARMLCNFADIYLMQGRIDEIQTYLNTFSAHIRQEMPRLLLLQGRVLRHNGQFGAASECLENVLTICADAAILCHTCVELAAIRHSQGQYQQAYTMAERAALLGEGLEASDYVHALMQMAGCAGFLKGMKEGRQLAEQAYDIMQAHPQEFSAYDRARLLQMLGQICWWHGDGQMAIRYCSHALNLLDDTETPLRARLLITLSTPTLYQKDYDTALDLAQKAIDICQELHLKEILPAAYAAFGNVLTRIGELEQAESALRAAINQAEAIGGARYSQVMAAGYLAQNLALQGRLNEARSIAEQALARYENQPVVYDVYVCRSVLADLSLDMDKFEQAKTIYTDLIAIGEITQYRIPLAMAYFGLAYILLKEKKHEQALHYSQQSLVLLEPAMMQQLYLDQHERALVIFGQLVKHMPDNNFVQRVYHMLSTASDKPQPPSVSIIQPDLLQIKTLGDFRVLREGREIEPRVFTSAKARDLLAYFVTFRSKSINLEKAIDALWPDGTGSTSAFHTALYRVRIALRRAGEKEKFILSEVGEYRLDTAKFDVDVEHFDSLLKRAISVGGVQSAEFYERALALYQGEYFDNLYYEWLILERERLQRDYLTALNQYSDLLLADAQYPAAADWLRKALELNPYDETLHIKYMRILHQMGQQQGLIAHYKHLKTLLADAFGASPLPETQGFYQQLMGGE